MKHILGITLLAGVSLNVSSAMAAPAAPMYVAKAGAGDLFETQSSRMVLETSKNPKVRAFATQMISDHAKSTAIIKAAVARSHMHAARPKLEAPQMDMIVALKAANGPKRDSLYLMQQHKAHELALTLHQDYAAHGDKPALTVAAATIVPVVKKHISMMPMAHS